MPWLRIDDTAVFAPKVLGLGNDAFGALVRVAGYASAHRTNGWVPTEVVRMIANRPAVLAKLRTVKLGGRSPVLHAPGDECTCLAGVEWPTDDPGYRVHDYLDRNPSRAEHDVHRAKGRELRDKELKHLVKRRDGNACRYCGDLTSWADKRSPKTLTIDHVDPKLAAGADNLVVACLSCNSRKRDCTPEAAGMVLLPPPLPGTVPDEWWPRDHDPAGIDRAWPTTDPTAGSTTDPTAGSTTDRPPIGSEIGPPVDHRSDPGQDPAQNSDDVQQHTTRSSGDATTGGVATGMGRGGSGSGTPPGPRAGDVGPAGRRPVIGPATTPRHNLTPNPYRKASTSNPPPAREDQP